MPAKPTAVRAAAEEGDSLMASSRRSHIVQRATRDGTRADRTRPTQPKRPVAIPRESLQRKRARTAEIVARLHTAYPDAKCALEHRNPFELLVATILSAQCTDKRVNMTTPALFHAYPSPETLAQADPSQVTELIKPTGFFNNKTKSILGASRVLVERFHGEVPRTMPELLQLPGVARKTANVVLGTAYGLNEGVVVDTHVGRIARRLALTRHEDPQKVEKDLMTLIPREEWTIFAHMVIFHGRQCCTALRPQCGKCPLADLCPSAFKV